MSLNSSSPNSQYKLLTVTTVPYQIYLAMHDDSTKFDAERTAAVNAKPAEKTEDDSGMETTSRLKLVGCRRLVTATLTSIVVDVTQKTSTSMSTKTLRDPSC